ncbi:SLATT domain-containing protein [Amycolatopsis sp. OK19-0408]|uniref:SLATT domain-containing protein n=1 Tax=Amycolatopsis iheyensis TaxID=2945988 RepID=A0A9X2SJD0_9PSEU|nr:SLATT domain-containing protein [Amycolatopsis iheyensis]MCR6483908.1 SLATT domain-containing protein [Amycolatopsis iheyensis]
MSELRGDDRALPPMVLAKRQWYVVGSRRHRRAYVAAELTAICVAAAFGADSAIVAVLGAIVLVVTSARAAFQPHENWVEFSPLRYDLEREIPPYDTDTAVQALVLRVEDLARDSGQRWTTRQARLWSKGSAQPGPD